MNKTDELYVHSLLSLADLEHVEDEAVTSPLLSDEVKVKKTTAVNNHEIMMLKGFLLDDYLRGQQSIDEEMLISKHWWSQSSQHRAYVQTSEGSMPP